MEKPRLSAIIPIRNRSGIRLENCLRSLRWQDVDASTIEIVLSDFGSDPDHLASIKALAETYDARVVETVTDEVWNRAKVLNIGIQSAASDLVFCTDADMIFQPTFLSTIFATHEKFGGHVMALCKCRDLPESVPEQLWTVDSFPDLRGKSAIRDTSGTGACQAAPKSFFEHARGYDEKFVYWGAEDVDMSFRAEKFGLRLHWMSDDDTSMLHQWHPTMKNDRKLTFHINRLRYKITRHFVVKNRAGWGLRR